MISHRVTLRVTHVEETLIHSTVAANCARLSVAWNARTRWNTLRFPLTLTLAGRHFVALSRGLRPLGSARSHKSGLPWLQARLFPSSYKTKTGTQRKVDQDTLFGLTEHVQNQAVIPRSCI